MEHLKRVCVYCGSSSGSDPKFAAIAAEFGALLADRGITLIYGGGRVGLMGTIADAALASGAEVIGVIPHGLERKEVAHRGLTRLEVVESMHDRKAMMAELSDAFVALPGGMGTLEELFEVLTWAQLGIHRKPCAILNVAGYYDGLIRFLDHAVSSALLKQEHRDMLLVERDAAQLLGALQRYRAPDVPKWITPAES